MPHERFKASTELPDRLLDRLCCLSRQVIDRFECKFARDVGAD